MELIEEGFGESASPARAFGYAGLGHVDVKGEIYARLVEIGNEETVSDPNFLEQLDAHFSRLPPRYRILDSLDCADQSD